MALTLAVGTNGYKYYLILPLHIVHILKFLMYFSNFSGFTKSEMQVMDPRQANFQETVNLVERNTAPGGYQLVCPEESGKIRSQFDLVELAGEIQTADKFTRATAGSKLSVIAEQVRFLQEQARIIKRGLSDRHSLL